MMPLLKLNFYHEYFLLGTIPDLSIRPSNTTAVLLQRHGIHIAKSTEGFSLYSSASYPGDGANALLDEKKTLEFTLQTAPARFVEITDAPEAWTGSVTLQIDAESNVGQPTFLEQDFDVPQIALSILPSAFTGDLPRTVDSTFQARKTARRYFVFNQSELDLNDALVTDDQGRHFNVQAIQMAHQPPALLFDSGEKTYKLSERPASWMQLATPKKRKPLINRLPTPSTSLAFTGGGGMPLRACSDIFVYL